MSCSEKKEEKNEFRKMNNASILFKIKTLYKKKILLRKKNRGGVKPQQELESNLSKFQKSKIRATNFDYPWLKLIFLRICLIFYYYFLFSILKITFAEKKKKKKKKCLLIYMMYYIIFQLVILFL